MSQTIKLLVWGTGDCLTLVADPIVKESTMYLPVKVDGEKLVCIALTEESVNKISQFKMNK